MAPKPTWHFPEGGWARGGVAAAPSQWRLGHPNPLHALTSMRGLGGRTQRPTNRS